MTNSALEQLKAGAEALRLDCDPSCLIVEQPKELGKQPCRTTLPEPIASRTWDQAVRVEWPGHWRWYLLDCPAERNTAGEVQRRGCESRDGFRAWADNAGELLETIPSECRYGVRSAHPGSIPGWVRWCEYLFELSWAGLLGEFAERQYCREGRSASKPYQHYVREWHWATEGEAKKVFEWVRGWNEPIETWWAELPHVVHRSQEASKVASYWASREEGTGDFGNRLPEVLTHEGGRPLYEVARVGSRARLRQLVCELSYQIESITSFARNASSRWTRAADTMGPVMVESGQNLVWVRLIERYREFCAQLEQLGAEALAAASTGQFETGGSTRVGAEYSGSGLEALAAIGQKLVHELADSGKKAGRLSTTAWLRAIRNWWPGPTGLTLADVRQFESWPFAHLLSPTCRGVLHLELDKIRSAARTECLRLGPDLTTNGLEGASLGAEPPGGGKPTADPLPDGPVPPCSFRLAGKVFRLGDGRSPQAFRLLQVFWDRECADVNELAGTGCPVWADPVSDSTVQTAINRFNNRATPVPLGWKLRFSNGTVYRDPNPSKSHHVSRA